MIAAAAELGHADTPEAAFAKCANELWPGFVAELEAQSGVSVDYRRNGSLLVALKSAGPTHSHGGEHPTAPGGAPNPHAQGADISMLTAEQAREMEPLLSEDIVGALLAPHEAQIDTHALVRALAAAFAKAGGKLSANEAAVRVEIEGGRAVGVRTPFKLYHADAVVLAAGAWTSRIEGLPPEAVPQVIPIKGEIVVLTPPSETALPKHVVWGNDIYVVPRTGRLLVGATVERAGFDTSKSAEAYRWLLRQSAGLGRLGGGRALGRAQARHARRFAAPRSECGGRALCGERPVSQRHPVCTGGRRAGVPPRFGRGGGDRRLRSQAVRRNQTPCAGFCDRNGA
jgi:glycine oxidase